MAVVSRLVLNHPALGTTGGAALHTAVEALYQKLGDAVASRWYQLTDFDQTETVDLEHNFDTDLTNLRWDLYVYVGAQWVLVTTTSSPARSAFTVIEKVGFEDVTLQITNNTGGNDLLAAVVITNDPLHLANGDVADVTVTAPTAGQLLRYDGTKWVNASVTASVTAVGSGGERSIAGDTTIGAGENGIVILSTNNTPVRTITAPAHVEGFIFTVKNTDGIGGSKIARAGGTGKIEGLTVDFVMSNGYGAYTFFSDGANWWRIN